MSTKKSRKSFLTEFSAARGYDFHVPGLGTAARVDRANGIIREVGLITSGVQARGHELHVDDTTLAQMLACANKRGKVPVKLNHPSAIENVCGFVTNFSIKGGKLTGDWHLLKSHDEYETMLERAERMPECFGMSGAFMGEAEMAGEGRQLARCTELLAFDCVAQPAAMPSGLFSRGAGGAVDTREGGMSDTNADPNAVPAEMPAWFKPFSDQFKAQGEQLAALTSHVQAQQQQALAEHLLGLTPEERAGLTAEDMEQYGITAEDLAQINAVAAEMAGTGEGGEGAPAGGEGAAPAGAGPSRSGTVPSGPGQSNAVAAMQAEIRQLKTFQAGIQREKLNELERGKQAEVDLVITTLEEKSAALLIELEAKDAVIARLENSAQHIPASRNSSETLFEAKADSATATEFEKKVTAKYEALTKLNPNANEKQLFALKAEATKFCVRAFPRLFEAHRAHAVTLGR